MIKIVRTEQNQWGIVAPDTGVVMEPSDFGLMIDQAQALGIEPRELEAAFTDMIMLENNCAEFGINRTFIYSEKVQIITRQAGLTPAVQEEFIKTDSIPFLMVGVA